MIDPKYINDLYYQLSSYGSALCVIPDIALTESDVKLICEILIKNGWDAEYRYSPKSEKYVVYVSGDDYGFAVG